MTDLDEDALEAAWSPARAAGVIGSATIDELRDHAAGYVPAAWRVPGAAPTTVRALDLGTGAGIPGLLVAHLLPGSVWTLVDANERRCRFARAAVESVGLEGTATVVAARAETLGHDATHRGDYDLVVVRRFGPPAEVLELGAPLLAPGGWLVVSSTLARDETWAGARVAELGLTRHPDRDLPTGRFVEWQRTGPVAERFPRRPAARRRDPLA